MDRRQAARRIVVAAVLVLFFALPDARGDVRDGDPTPATATVPGNKRETTSRSPMVEGAWGRSPKGKPPDPQPRPPVWGLRRPLAGSTPGTLGLLPDSEAVQGSFRGTADELRPVAVPAPSAEAVRFHQTGNWLWAFRQLWALAVPAAVPFQRTFRAAPRCKARRIGRNWFFTIGVYAVGYFTLLFVIDLPLAYYAGFVRQHAYGLSHQSLARWSGNALKGLLVDLTGAFLFLWVPYLLLARSPRRWWIYTTVLSVPFSLFVMLIAPIWIDPLFNKFGPMKDPALEHRIAALADRAGISESRIYEVDKSADSRALNAYVKGFLNSKRIVLYDTLLAQLGDREVLVVMGHEMGHYECSAM